MTRTINQEIENALTDKGYKWKNISIKPRLPTTMKSNLMENL